MAEINRESQEFAEIMAQVNREMRLYGELHVQTAERLRDAEMKSKFGIDNFGKATGMGADALAKFGAAAFSSGKSLLAAKNGTADFSGAMDQMTDAAKMAAVALTLLVPGGPLIKGLVAGIGLLTVSVLEAGKEYMKATNAMREQLSKGYQDLALSGAAASDGMTGLFKDAKKLGLTMNDIGQYTELIAANSKDLALFSGTVFEGRQKFADMGEAMEPFKESLLNSGLKQEQINAGAMGYLKLQTRIGMSQTQTSAQLADGAKKYLIEMDGLSKITGETRKGMEDQMEAARSEERFAAKLQEMRSQGRHDEAKQLELANLMISKENKALAQGFRDASTGMITTEAAQKAMLVTQNQVMVQADRMSNGLAKAGEAATIIGQTAGNTAKSMTGLAKAGAYFGADYAADLRSGMTDFSKAQIAAEKELEAQGGKGAKALDPLVQKQTELTLKIQEGNKAVENFVFAGVGPSTDALIRLTHNTTLAADAMAKMFGVGVGPQPPAGPPQTQQQKSNTAASKDMPVDASKSVKPRPQDQLKAQVWDSKYASGWNPDGSAKNTVPAAPAPAAPATAPATAPAAPAPAPAATSSSAPATRSAAPAAHGQSGGASDGKPKLARVSSASGKSASVNEKYAPAFQNLLDYLGNVGYDVTSLGGYNDRDATGQPGVKSIHAHGAAIDINPGANPFGSKLITDMPPEIGQIAASLGLGWGGNWKSVKDAMHFSAARSEGGSLLKASDGGVFQGPSSGYNVELHGKEAVIPLKDGAVPVSLNLKDALNTPSMGGYNEYAGLNQGPLSTDIDAVKNIAAAAGAFDKASQTITDPATWKQILSSGLATNYELGTATIGTKGIEGLGEDIAMRLKEIKEQSNVSTDLALKQVTDEFKSAMAQVSQQLASLSQNQNSDSSGTVATLMQELVTATKSGVDVQQKILAANY